MSDTIEELQSGAVLARRLVNVPTLSSATEVPSPHYVIDLPLGDNLPVMRVSIYGEEPVWVWKVLGRLKKLGSYESDWDSYGGQPTHPNAIESGIELLASIMSPESPAPAIVPASSGGLQFEWNESDVYLEVEVSPQGHISMLFEHIGTGESFEKEAPSLADLHSAVAQLV